ncbi:unnamed protein product [[Actinomadura] parvosata subsp. kistnae]|nr:unnamed protein product [Actinomadura parvosata subsp. kistnae]
MPSPAAGTAPLGGAEQALPPGMAIPGHGQPGLTGPHPVPAMEPAAPKDGVPGANRPLLPPRLVWRLAAHKPVLDHGRGAARLTDDWQTWRFLPDKKLNRFYPAGTWTVTATAKGANGTTVTQYASFELKRESRLTAVRAEKSARAGGVRLRGSLTRVDPRGLTDYGPFAKQRLEVLWRPDESSAWQAVGEATTDAAGAFVGTVQGRTDGFWRVRFPGTGHYAADLSKARQIAQ